jgi:sugar phosphate isomerase/epimerase
MNNPISLCYLTVAGVTLPESVSVAAEAGYQAVGLRLLNRPREADVFTDAQLLRETERRLADTGLSVLDCEIFWLLPETRVAEFGGLFEAMQRLGARLLLVLGRDPDPLHQFDTFAQLCEATAPYGIRCCLEFCRITSVETLQDAVGLVRRSGAPNARVLVDALHLSRSGGTPEQVAQVDPSLFEYAQLCDAPAQIPDPERMRLEPGSDRLLPGQGGLPLVELVRALPAGLPIGIEAPVEALAERPPLERARLALAGMRAILETAASA